MSEYVSIEEFNALKNAYLDTVALLANALKRITQLEEAFFAHDEEGEIIKNSEDKPAISSNLIKPTDKPIEEKKEEDLLIQNTTLSQKANALTDYLKEKIKPGWSGKTVIENERIYDFFYNIVNKEIRWPAKMRGYRSAKKAIIERAAELRPDEVEIVRNKSGNKITGLALKASIKRTDTYTC
jgi:hypothetical protein